MGRQKKPAPKRLTSDQREAQSFDGTAAVQGGAGTAGAAEESGTGAMEQNYNARVPVPGGQLAAAIAKAASHEARVDAASAKAEQAAEAVDQGEEDESERMPSSTQPRKKRRTASRSNTDYPTPPSRLVCLRTLGDGPRNG